MMVMKTGVGALTDDEARFVEIYGRFAWPIQAYCARRTRFAGGGRRLRHLPDRLAENRPDTGRGRGPAWLYGVAFRVLSHQWRHNVRSRKLIERLRGLAEVEDYAPEVLLVRSEEHRVVLAASARLKPVDQEILRLTLWEEPHTPTWPLSSASSPTPSSTRLPGPSEPGR